jgi:hypothetical protein
VAEVESLAKSPFCVASVPFWVVGKSADEVVLGKVEVNMLAPGVPTLAASDASPAALWLADATGTDVTVNNPANNAVVAVSAMRLRIVVFDIFFLSLVRVRDFLTLARRSFDLLILFPYGTHV